MGLTPGSKGSGVTFEFPKNYFVWKKKKIDSRPHKSDPGLHFFFGLGGNQKVILVMIVGGLAGSIMAVGGMVSGVTGSVMSYNGCSSRL